MTASRHLFSWPLGLAFILFVGNLRLASADDLSYKVKATGGSGSSWSLLIVSRTKVTLSNGFNDLINSCTYFVAHTTTGWDRARPELRFKDTGNSKHIIRIFIEHKGDVDASELLQRIRDACVTQQAEEPHRQQLDREEAERQGEAQAREDERRWAAERAAEAKRVADFKAAILGALRAADEPDPFASVRGDFDLAASDSHQWKTSLKVPEAEKCGLIKTPPAAPTSASAWTFACTFRTCRSFPVTSKDGDFHLNLEPCFAGDGYEAMVKALKSVLNSPYQPDERAVNINQVFFADPSKPARRLFVAKISESTIGVSIVAVRLAGGESAVTAAAPFPSVPTVLPTTPAMAPAPTISEEIERVRNGIHRDLPPIQSTGVPSRNGMAILEVKNNTAYTLTALFSGPIERRAEVPPRGSISIDLPAGSYKLVGRVDAPNVLPSYGEHVLDASSAGVEFYIQ